MARARGSPARWILVGVLWVVYLINMGFPMYGGTVANTYMTDALGMSRGVLGAGFALFTFFQGASGVLVLLCINRRGVRVTLLVGALLIICGALLMRLAVTSSWQYVITYGLVLGLGVGFGAVLPITTLVTHRFSEKRALAMSLVLTAGGVGGLVAAPLVDRVIRAAGGDWRAAWILVAAASAVAALVTLLFIRDKPVDPEAEAGTAPAILPEDPLSNATLVDTGRVHRTVRDWRAEEALRSPALWLFGVGSLAFTAPFMLCVAHSVIHLRDLGHPSALASMSIGLLTIFSIVGRLVAGVWGDRFEPRLIWSASLILIALGCLALIRASSLLSIVAYTFLVGNGFGAAYVCRPVAIANYFGASAFASINGVLSTVLTVFTAAIPYLGGLDHDIRGNYTITFVGVAAVAVMGTIGLLSIRPPTLEAATAGGRSLVPGEKP